jgi:putative membrane protein
LDNENEEFIINEGIFNKQKTIIQLNRIQQVNINQSLIQRLVGFIDVDKALKEGQIKALSHPSL